MTQDQLRAAELEHERAERSFDKREVDAWKMLGWEVFRPSSAVQNRDTRELIPNQIEALAVSAGRVWMATKNGLLNFDTKLGTMQWFHQDMGLASNEINSLAVKISQFNPKTERWQTYTNEDGLGVGTLTCLDVVGNYLWIGSDQGISRFKKSNNTWDYFRAAKSGLVADEITKILVDGKSIWAVQ